MNIINCINCGAPIQSSNCLYCDTNYSSTLCYTQHEATNINDNVDYTVSFIEYKENKLLCGLEYHLNDGTIRRQIDTESLIGIDGTIVKVCN